MFRATSTAGATPLTASPCGSDTTASSGITRYSRGSVSRSLLRRVLEQLCPPRPELAGRRRDLALAPRPGATATRHRGQGGRRLFFWQQLPLGQPPERAGDEVQAQPGRHLVEQKREHR